LFSSYGPILDITAKKTEKMREQAFIVYNNVASATTAKRSLNGFTFFSKPIVSSVLYNDPDWQMLTQDE
jgi:RNA recognition motif-containing protein